MSKCGNILFAGEGLGNLAIGSLNKSTDGGVNWSQVDLGGNSSAILCMAVKGSFVYAGSYQNDLYLSSNGGLNWTNIIINTGLGTGVFKLGVSGNNLICYVNTNSAYYISTNDGYNWTPILSPVLNVGINDFLNTENAFYAATSKGIIFSTDHGFTWTRPMNNGLPVLADSTMPLYSLTSSAGRIYGSYKSSIYYTIDSGENWIPTNIILGPFGYSRSMVSQSNILFAGVNGISNTNKGVFTTTSGGENWSLINNGLPQSTGVISLLINGSYLYAGTYGKGIYRYPLSSITNIHNYGSIPEKFNLEQNYPNPFNPSTKINFSLPIDSKVTLKVYDITGREISTLLNGELKLAGYYTVDFNGGNFASGYYFYRVQTEKEIATKKMVLIK